MALRAPWGVAPWAVARPTKPATWGAAADVPQNLTVPPSLSVVWVQPGAPTLTQSP
jgi:hypothetical protein